MSALVARQMAALRRAGYGVADAVKFILPSLPQGSQQQDAQVTLTALESGAAPPGVADPVMGLVARGDAASAEALETMAEALESEAAAHDAQRSAALWLSIILAGPLLLGTLFGWFRPDMEIYGENLPAVTDFMLGVLDVLRWLGPPLAAVIIFLALRLVRRSAPGAHDLRTASALKGYAAAVASGAQAPAVPPLGPIDRHFFEWRQQQTSSADAALLLAEELERAGRERSRAFAMLAPFLGLFILSQTVGAVVISLYLPIFTLAGSIK